MLTVPLEAWIGNAATVVRGVGGTVTHRSPHSGSTSPGCQLRDEKVSGEDQERGFLTGHEATL